LRSQPPPRVAAGLLLTTATCSGGPSKSLSKASPVLADNLDIESIAR
jgi:hypothetical protein